MCSSRVIPTRSTSGGIDIITTNNQVAIPPDSGGNITGIQAIQNNGFDFAVGNSTNVAVNYDLSVRSSHDEQCGRLLPGAGGHERHDGAVLPL